MSLFEVTKCKADLRGEFFWAAFLLLCHKKSAALRFIFLLVWEKWRLFFLNKSLKHKDIQLPVV